MRSPIWRDLVLPPQVAFDHVWGAFLTGHSATISDAFQDALASISTAQDSVPDTVSNPVADLAAGTW